MYTATGQREYMANYFEELNTTRRRENALEFLQSITATPMLSHC